MATWPRSQTILASPGFFHPPHFNTYELNLVGGWLKLAGGREMRVWPIKRG